MGRMLLKPRPGDMLLTGGSGLIASSIEWAEARRYGRDAPEARWSHAALLVSSSGDLIEATSRGMTKGSLATYTGRPHAIWRPPYPQGGADRAVHTIACMLGEPYGYLEIIALALAFATQTRWRFMQAGTRICSGAVAEALQAGGIDMIPANADTWDPTWDSPADLLHIAQLQSWERIL